MSESDPAGSARPFTAVPKPEAEETEPPAAEPRPRKRFLEMPEGALGFFILWLLAAAGGALIVVFWPWVSSTGAPDNAAVSDRLAVLETRVGQIAAGHAPQAAAASFEEERRNLVALKARVDADEARLAALESGNEGASGTAPSAARSATAEKALADLRSDLDAQQKASTDALAKLDARLSEAEKRLPAADLSARLDSLAPKSDVAALDARLAKLENRDTASLVRRTSALLALADLMRASEREQPFTNELDVLRALVPASPEIADLSRHAKKGVPSVTILSQRFAQDADSILAAEHAARAQNWLERVWLDLVNVVSVRRIGNVPGSDTEARVARAEFALKNGDFAAAVADVRSLDAPARAAAAPWLKDAEARLAVDADARALTNRVVAGLAAAPAREPVQSQPGSQR